MFFDYFHADFFTHLAAFLYFGVAVLCILETLLEGERSGGKWSLLRICGLLACFAWPVLLFMIFARLAFEKRRA